MENKRKSRKKFHSKWNRTYSKLALALMLTMTVLIAGLSVVPNLSSAGGNTAAVTGNARGSDR